MVLDFDVILEEIGDFGRYQIFIVFLLSVPACFMNAFFAALVFISYTPSFLCVPGDPDPKNISHLWNDTDLVRACTYKLDGDPDGGHRSSGNETLHHCTNFDYDRTYFEETIVTQWDLVCDRAIYPKTMMSLHSLVTLVGCLVNSYLQDLWGRKRAFFLVITANMIGGICCAFAPNFVAYAVLRSFIAWSATSTWNNSYTWALEYVGPTKRTMVTTIMCILYGVAAVTVGGLAWLCDTWVKLTLAGSMPFLLLYSYVFLVDESPRWLISKGRNKEALKTVRKMVRWDGKTLKEETAQKLLGASEAEAEPLSNDERHRRSDGSLTKERMVSRLDGETRRTSIPKAETPNKAQRPRVQDLFLTRNLRWKTCLLTYCWAANLLTYTAIAFNMENLKGNLFVTYTLQAAMEIPASVLILFLLDRYGRVPPLAMSMVVCGILLFGAVPVDWFGLNAWIIIGLTLAAKFGITISFGILAQLAGESYPTQIRGLGTGFSSFVGTLGGFIMPYVVHSARVYKMLPMILMGTAAVTSGLSVLFLPDTIGRYMPETVAEAEHRESVGYAALKENWRAMRCGRRAAYRTVQKTELEKNSRNGIVDKENEDL